MSDPSSSAAAEAAAKAAAHAVAKFNKELWTLYGFGITFTLLRTYARVKARGFGGLAIDDYTIWGAIVFYSAQYTLAFFAVNHAGGMANNSMTDPQRAALDVNSTEYKHRILGSKIQVAGWTMYICLIFLLRMSMLVFYTRLTEGLGRTYRMRINIGYLIMVCTFIVSIVTMYSSCRPLRGYWQISPNPGKSCQAAISMPIVWSTFSSSIIDDLYLIMIPLPMLWSTTLKPIKKIASSFVLGAGVFVLICSLLKTVFVMTDSVNGATLAGSWGTRESFASVIITNLPMVFPLIRSLLSPVFGGLLSTQKQQYKTPGGFRTIGGGTSNISGHTRNGRTMAASAGGTNLSMNESEEHIVRGIRMDNMNVFSGQSSADTTVPHKGIVMTNEFEVTTDQSSIKHEV
ncbi:hypothetical protein CMQ_7409 [Grosmannia clavigera kw1407]|uniref:Rhodopsin domain-containing protein n=1 Tax=Grosmannia clavigera (strain kw1407 / UAMH 11150) TaxID=655863 RepID=F0XQG5_GROCL|nr:uncharacterized protein CMQ_7409 [Grosmannia clavigera kw1407]EFX00407.1 hypothetical protein CMQ_7409 [Grosmannia clavigera kw1407]